MAGFREQMVAFMVNPREKAAIRIAAAKAGMSMSKFTRRIVLDHIKSKLAESGVRPLPEDNQT